MAISDLIPTMDDQALANLRANAQRLAVSGAARQQTDAAALIPLIEAEVADRIARKPAKAVKPKAVRVAKPKKAKAPKIDVDAEPDHESESGLEAETGIQIESDPED